MTTTTKIPACSTAAEARSLLGGILDGLRRRRRGDDWIAEQLAAREPSGAVHSDLRGKKSGDFRIVGYVAPSPVSPFWAGRCTSCGAYEVLRAAAIRSGKASRCLECRKA